MAAYKDEQRGTWYVSFHYYDWTGKNCRKVKRGFKTKREATEWERHFRMKEAADLDMTFEEFVQAYTRDMKPKLKHNTWLTKEHILRTKLLPYFKDKKMRDIRPKDIIQWQNEQISYRDEKGKPYKTAGKLTTSPAGISKRPNICRTPPSGPPLCPPTPSPRGSRWPVSGNPSMTASASTSTSPTAPSAGTARPA